VRLADFSTVLFDAVNLCGFDLSNITDQSFRTVRQFSNQRIRMSWEAYPWSSLTKYVEGAVAHDTVTDLRSVAIPADSGEVVGVYSRNPLTTTEGLYVSYALAQVNGVEKIVVNAPVTTVWIEYRTKCPQFTGDLWSPTVAYAAGAQCYFDSGSGTPVYMPVAGKPHTGNFYTATEAIPAGTMPINAVSSGDARWKKVEVPYIFASYIARGVFSDFLRSEQQYEDAGKADVDASVVLEQEFDKELRQQGQIRRMNFINPY
jgi:hypothetical protein